MLYNGERIGDGTRPKIHTAVDPVDGTTLTAKSLPNTPWPSSRVMSERHTMFEPGPLRLHGEDRPSAGDLADIVDLEPTPSKTTLSAHREGPRPPRCRELTVVQILDRPRHEADLVRRVREAGSRIKFLLWTATSPARSGRDPTDTNVDLMIGIGGTPEGVPRRLRAQVPGRHPLRQALPPQRRRTQAGPGRGLRPRQGPHAGRHGAQQQRVRRGHGRHGRRAAARGAVLAGPGDDALAVDALAVGRGAPDRDPAPDQHLEPRPEVRPLVMS